MVLDWVTVILLIGIGLILIVVELIFVPGVTIVGILGFILVAVGIWIGYAALGTTIQGTTVPGFDTQRLHTSVELEAGQTFVLGGLILLLWMYLLSVALLLGGIGVASAMGAYMAQKADTVAVLRCLGATSREVLAVYLAQAAVMGLKLNRAGGKADRPSGAAWPE